MAPHHLAPIFCVHREGRQPLGTAKDAERDHLVRVGNAIGVNKTDTLVVLLGDHAELLEQYIIFQATTLTTDVAQLIGCMGCREVEEEHEHGQAVLLIHALG